MNRHFRPQVEMLEGRDLLSVGFGVEEAVSIPVAAVQHDMVRIEPAPVSMGMEVERVSSYMGAWMFTDALRQSQPWVRVDVDDAGNWTNNPNIRLDSETGYPTLLRRRTDVDGNLIREAVVTSMFIANGSHYPQGTPENPYTAWWRGDGQVEFGGDVTSVRYGETTQDGYHVAYLTVEPGYSDTQLHPGTEGRGIPGGLGIQVTITASSDSDTNPFYDAHLWMPDYNGQSFVGQVWQPGADFSPFHPLFLERLEPFDNLRFMDASVTGESTISYWSDVRPWSHATQATGNRDEGFMQNGLSPVYMVQLANELDANIWLNISHAADLSEPRDSGNNYVVELARYVHENLESNLNVHVEWSNEIWNSATGCETNAWVWEHLGGPPPESEGGRGYLSHPRYQEFVDFVAGQQTIAFDIWSDVFSDRPDRLTRVVAGVQELELGPDDLNYNDALLTAMDQRGGHYDAFSVSAYVLPVLQTGMNKDQILAAFWEAIPRSLDMVQAGHELASQHGVRFVAYEMGVGGGPLADGTVADAVARNTAVLDPEMYDIYGAFLRELPHTGLELANHHEFTQRGTLDNPMSLEFHAGLFGALSYLDQPIEQAHQYRALLDFMSSTNATSASNEAPTASATDAPVVAADKHGTIDQVVNRLVRIPSFTPRMPTMNPSLFSPSSAGFRDVLPGFLPSHSQSPSSGTQGTADITGLVFLDSNGNDALELGESELADQIVVLDSFSDGEWLPVAVTNTDSTGNYRFSGHLPGIYRVRTLAIQGKAKVTARGVNGAEIRGTADQQKSFDPAPAREEPTQNIVASLDWETDVDELFPIEDEIVDQVFQGWPRARCGLNDVPAWLLGT